MNLEVLRYSSLLSLPLFLLNTYYLIRTNPKFSIHTETISNLIFYLQNPTLKMRYKVSFLVKSIIDIGFWCYLVMSETLAVTTQGSLMFVVSMILFALLGFFTEESHSFIHRLILFGFIGLWFLWALQMAHLTNNQAFIQWTYAFAAVSFLVSVSYHFILKTNIILQIVISFLVFLWLSSYVYLFL